MISKNMDNKINLASYRPGKTVGRKSSGNLVSDLVINIGAVYLVITFLAFFLLPGKFANAGLSQKDMKNSHSDYLTSLEVVGSGELTWFGFSIYNASLWTRTGEYKSIESSMPIALSITYLKNIDSEALAERTVEEWARLGVFETVERETWGERLKDIWPNVEPGDSIITLVTEDKATRFYHNNTLLTVLRDPKFGQALLSIWLDPDTSEPELREQLIGYQGDEQ